MKKFFADFFKAKWTSIVIVILGFTLIGFGKKALDEIFPQKPSANSSAIAPSQPKTITQPTTAVATRVSLPKIVKAVVSPGNLSEEIPTHGRKFKSETYRAGNEGYELIFIRFQRLTGKWTSWQDVTHEHLEESETNLDARGVKAIQYYIPKDASSAGIEVAFR